MKAEIDLDERFFDVEYEIESDETIYGTTKGLVNIQSITEVFFNNNQTAKKELNLSDFKVNDKEAYEYIDSYLTETINESQDVAILT